MTRVRISRCTRETVCTPRIQIGKQLKAGKAVAARVQGARASVKKEPTLVNADVAYCVMASSDGTLRGVVRTPVPPEAGMTVTVQKGDKYTLVALVTHSIYDRTQINQWWDAVPYNATCPPELPATQPLVRAEYTTCEYMYHGKRLYHGKRQ